MDANPAAMKLFGYAKKEVGSLNFASLLTEDQIPTLLLALEELKKEGYQRGVTEYRLKDKEGKEVYVETRGSVIYREGRPYAIQGIARDITLRKHVERELKKAHDELERRVKKRTADLVKSNNQLSLEIAERLKVEATFRESEELFRHAFENAYTGVCIIGTNRRYLKVNNRLCEILGYSKEELESMTVDDFVYPEDMRTGPGFIERSIAGEAEETTIQRRYIHKQGHMVWMQIFCRVIRNAEGDALYFISHVQDITQQKLAEKALQESKDKFSKLFQASPVYTVVTTIEDGRFLDVNDAFMKVTGYEPEEVIGRTTTEVDLWANPEERIKFVKLGKEKGRFRDQEVIFLKKNGEPLIMLWSAETINIDGIPCFISALADITELKKAKEALQESHDELEIRVKERTGELAEAVKQLELEVAE
ncbi:MAG: PAS domain S-box protein [Pseudomonadota bacterium]